jgi:hypothetical protein
LFFFSSLPSTDAASATAPSAVDFTRRTTFFAIDVSPLEVFADFEALAPRPAAAFALLVAAFVFAPAVLDDLAAERAVRLDALASVDEFLAADAVEDALLAGLVFFASFERSAAASPASDFDSSALPDFAAGFFAVSDFEDAFFAVMIVLLRAIAAWQQWMAMHSVPLRPAPSNHQVGLPSPGQHPVDVR